jgi:hypothetical protein
MDSKDIVRNCYERQIIHFKMSLAQKLKQEIEKLRLEYIWHSKSSNDINWACEIIKERYDNIQKQNLFADVSCKNPLFTGEYTDDGCIRYGKSVKTWLKAGIFKSRMSTGRRFLPCAGEEDAVYY